MNIRTIFGQRNRNPQLTAEAYAAIEKEKVMQADSEIIESVLAAIAEQEANCTAEAIRQQAERAKQDLAPGGVIA